MTKKISLNYILTLIFILFLMSCNSRNNDIRKSFEYLSSIIENSPNDVLISLDSIRQYVNLDIDEQLSWNILYIRAYDEIHDNIPEDSIVEYTTKTFSNKNNIKEKAYCFFYLGRLYAKRQDYDKSMEAYLSALIYAERAKAFRLLGLTYSFIAKNYKNAQTYEKGIDALKNAEKSYILSHSQRPQIFALLDIGSLYTYMGLADSSLFYYAKAEVIARKYNDKDALSSISFQISKTYWDQGDLKSAEYYLDKCVEQLQDSSLLRKVQLLKVQIRMKQHRYQEAKELLIELVTYGNELSQTMKAANYISLAQIEKQLSNYKEALKWQEKYINLYDTIVTTRLNNNTSIVELNKQISNLTTENKHLSQKGRIYRYQLVILFSIGIILIIAYSLKKSKANALSKQVQELNKETEGLKHSLYHNSVLISKINIMAQTPSHKQAEMHKQFEDLSLDKDISSNDWNELENRVNLSFNNLIQRLKLNHENLTNEDIQTIILISLGYKSGEISTLLNIEMGSLKKRRQRLRQRLGLSEKENLEDFINNSSNNQ